MALTSSKLALCGGPPVRLTPFTQWPIHGDEERRGLLEVLDSGRWCSTGSNRREFADRFAAFCGAKHGQCVSSGTVALEVALRALGVGPGDEVIVPALTWIATSWAVVQVGAVPVFADVREDDWCLDPQSVVERISPSTRAILPVHLYGQIAEMDEILRIARQHDLFVVEDCAHAHGSRWRDRGVGTLGHIGCFSFQQDKAITAGEGGALITDDANLARRIHALTDCGRPKDEGGAPGYGGNHRMSEFQHAVLLAQLGRLDEQLRRKADNVARLRERIEDIAGISALPAKEQATRVGMYGFGLRYESDRLDGLPRKLFLAALQSEGIRTLVPYPVVYRSPLWTAGRDFLRWESGADPDRRLGLGARCPRAERIAAETGVVVPHEVFLGPAGDVDDVAAALAKVAHHRAELRFAAWNQRARDEVRKLLETLGVRW